MKKILFSKVLGKKHGFTLIELLVVIAIMGLLAVSILMTVARAQAKARDSQRASDLKSLQTAVEMFHEVNNVYPGEAGVIYTSHASWVGDTSNNTAKNKLMNDLSQYLKPLPKEPKCGMFSVSCIGSNGENLPIGVNMYYAYIKAVGDKGYELDSGMEARTDLVSQDGGVMQDTQVVFDIGAIHYGGIITGRYEIGSNLSLLDCLYPEAANGTYPGSKNAMTNTQKKACCTMVSSNSIGCKKAQ